MDQIDRYFIEHTREIVGSCSLFNCLLSHFCQYGGKFPRFVSREMEAMYIEELRSSVNLLMANLESMPVSKGGEFKLQKLKRGHNTSIMDMGQEDENALSKSDVVLSFTLEVGGETYETVCRMMSCCVILQVQIQQSVHNREPVVVENRFPVV